MGRQNAKLREKVRKEEYARIRALVDNAYKRDPRILKRKEEKAEKRRKKESKFLAKKLQEEEAARAAEEERRKEEEEKRAEAALNQKKLKEKGEEALTQRKGPFAYSFCTSCRIEMKETSIC